MHHRLEHAVARTAAAIAPCDRRVPVGGGRQRLRQDRLDAADQLLGAFDQLLEVLIHDL
jgi:hypothetical protein